MDGAQHTQRGGHFDVATLFVPASALGGLSPAGLASAALQEVEAALRHAEDHLRLFLTLDLAHAKVNIAEGEAVLVGGREEWLAGLEALRHTVASLSGTGARALVRETSRLMPDRAANLIRLIEEARQHATQILTWVSFMLEQDDEMQGQLEIVPTDQVERPPSGSVTFRLD